MRNLLLKTVNSDMTAHGGFIWPRSGEVRAKKWSPDPVCGNGLHGALHGCGDGSLFDWSPDAVWVVFEAIGEVVEFGGKAKCAAGTVLYAGDRKTATDMILAECGPVPCIGAFIIGGDGATVSGGDWATVSGGDGATVSGGDGAILSVKWHDGHRYRIATAYVGEDGIKPVVKYKCIEGTFVTAE